MASTLNGGSNDMLLLLLAGGAAMYIMTRKSQAATPKTVQLVPANPQAQKESMTGPIIGLLTGFLPPRNVASGQPVAVPGDYWSTPATLNSDGADYSGFFDPVGWNPPNEGVMGLSGQYL
jgi:hypothetical protein